ncbi:MAG TPA: molybdopterin-dependent oxidoreductase [Candidatus Polarisedimenticolia bacterium]|nr:molybdopterin-dependent oxidoreductase [Candidatus Polarisedimenticolia bacterium]
MGRFDRRARTGMLVGALAMFFALDVAFLLSMAGMPFVADSLGQAIIDVLPGFISIPLIEALHQWAKILLIVGVIALFLIDGAATGLLAASRRRTAAVLGLGLLPWVAAFAFARLFSPQRIEPVTSLIDAAVGAAVFLAALAFILPGALDRSTATGPASPSRRRALLGTAAIVGAIAIVSLPLSRIAAVGSGGLGNVALTARRLRARAEIAAADPAIDALPGITPRITANEDHYTVDTTLVKPRVLIDEWRLDIKGLVQTPFSLTYDQLLDLEAVEQVHTLECISNYVGGDLISTALWTGVPLPDLLNRAQVQPGAYDVVFTSVDGYTDSIPIAKAMEDKTLVAYLMNGKTVPQDHGYPARMLVPNIYGMKNVKWIRTIEVVNYDFFGYWQTQGWSDGAPINTNARIDLPNRNIRWTGGAITVAGIAFAGARGISKVELSTDGAKSWGLATLEAAMGPLTWRRWTYPWTPNGAGPAKLIVRATDGSGNTETPVGRAPYPDGATGYDELDVTIQRG